MCKIIRPRLRISWYHSPFWKHGDNFMFEPWHKICATKQCATNLINARTSTIIWVNYTHQSSRRERQRVYPTRVLCSEMLDTNKHTLGSVNGFLCCSVWSVTQHQALDVQGVVFSTEQSACKILMMLFWWRCWNVWFSCYEMCSTCVFCLNFYVLHLRVPLKFVRLIAESPACCCGGRINVILQLLVPL
jgi:hypothetical protein